MTDEGPETPITEEPTAPAEAPPAHGAGSRWPVRLRALSVAAFLCLPVGALGSRFGLWHYSVGLVVVSLGVALALLAGLVGAVVLVRQRRTPSHARSPGADASVAIAVILLLILFPIVRASLSAPPIHQVSTDLVDPPGFDEVRARRGADANPLSLTPEVAAAQQEHYPWIRPQVFPLRADDVYDAALRVLRERMVLEIVAADPIRRVIEATDTSFWFGFKDDFVVRVRFDERGARVDVRSISRVGVGDLGVNADRVAEFFVYLAEETGYDPGPFRPR